MRISISGAGYVGLVTAASLAELGHQVCCVDTDRSKIARLTNGEIPFYEPGLSELVSTGVERGLLRFTDDIADAVRGAEVALITVGTPPRLRDGEADLSFVFQAAADIVRAASGPITIVTKSTVPVGTGDVLEKRASLQRPELPVAVVSNPEFLREGSAVSDFRNPDRIVVGANGDWGRQALRAVYERQIRQGVTYLETERRTAELIKYAANAFLATKIAFANEIADLCEEIATDVDIVTEGMGLDSRIGAHFLKAGPGYGGSCFPKDTLALLRTAQDVGVSLRLVQETVAVNDARKRKMARRVIDLMGGDVQGRTIAVLGLAFKANTDDVRESPAIPLVESLQRAGATVRAYDPQAMRNAGRLFEGVEFCADAMVCAHGADAVVLVTDWDEFRKLDIGALSKVMRNKVIIDFRNILDGVEAEHLGFIYASVGRPPRRGQSTNVSLDGEAERGMLALAAGSGIRGEELLS